MKKIGIVTFHNAYNYGAVLQCYALQRLLNELNFNTEIIDYSNTYIMDNYNIFPKRNRNIKGYIRFFLKFILYNRRIRLTQKRYKNFDIFMSNNYHLSNKYTESSLIKNAFEEYNCLITGSDQVWNMSIVGELSDIYTLNFGRKNINRISYAASIGDSSLVIKNKDTFSSKLSILNHISVRENDAKEELKKIIEKPITVVLDPTLLLTREKWEEIIKNTFNYESLINKKYILAYVVEPDEEYIKIVNDLSRKTGLPIIHFDLKNPGYYNILKSAYTEGPLEFINYIKNAQYVVTTSFHATVFSIIFNKNFFIVPHKKTGSRVTNLLGKLELEGRAFLKFEDFKNIDYHLTMNWKKINEKLEKERKKSINWLVNAINNEKEEKMNREKTLSL